MRPARILAFALLVTLLGACDPDGKKDCAWTLEPEPDGKANQGYIPVCARNRKTMKQDCRMQATLELAKGYYGRTFRYSDMKLKSVGLPRTITSITFCE